MQRKTAGLYVFFLKADFFNMTATFSKRTYEVLRKTACIYAEKYEWKSSEVEREGIQRRYGTKKTQGVETHF